VTGPRTRLLAAAATALGLIAGGYDAHLAPQVDGWWHGLTGAPSASRIVGALLASALVWWIGSKANTRPFLWMSAGLLPLLPATTGLGSAALFFSGYTSILLFAFLLALTLRDLIPTSRTIPPAAAGLVAFAFFVLVGRYLPGPAGPQGDEPHYLLIAESLLQDGDVDLKNQFDERAFSKFTSADLDPHTAPRSPAGTMYAIHTPGLAALIAPGYAIGGFPGARVVVSAVLAIVVGLLCFAARSLFEPRAANFVFLLATFASPLPIYANSVFPDSVATLPVAATLACLISGHPALLTFASITIALLPWLHPRFLPLALLLALALTLRGRFSVFRALGIWTPVTVSLASLLFHFHDVFGRASLSAAYGPGFSTDVSLLRIPWGGTALLLDRQFGLLLFSPVLLLGITGAARLWERDRLLSATLGAAALSSLSVGGAFSMWWGGASAPARFLIGATPALLFFCAALWNSPKTRSDTRAALAGMTGYGAGLILLACMAPRALHNRSDGQSGLLRLLTPVLDVDRLFPGFVTEPSSLATTFLWGAAVIAVLMRPAAGLIPLAAMVGMMTMGSSRPLLEPFPASLRALEAWDDRRRTFGGLDLAESFVLDIPLGPSAGPLTPGARLHSPRFSLPAGLWTMRVEFRAAPAPDVLNVARVAIVGDDDDAEPFVTATLRVDENATGARFTLDAHQRRLHVRADGLQSKTTVSRVTLRPAFR
jgi:hypothetical protein